MTDQEIIDQIGEVRAKNNINWMQVLRIAMKHAPDETKIALVAIYADDAEISDLVRLLIYPSVRT